MSFRNTKTPLKPTTPAKWHVPMRPNEKSGMNEYYIVEGEWIDRLFASINFDDYESRQYLDRRLRAAGVFDKLEEMGIKDGDPVVIGEMEFEYEH